MKEILTKAKIPIAIFIFLLLGFMGYRTLTKEDAPVSDTIQRQNVAPNTLSVKAERLPSQELIPLVALINGVNFDLDFFGDPVFRSLIDTSQPIEPEEKGRPNPFGGILERTSTSTVEDLGFEEDRSAPATGPASLPPATPGGTRLIP